MNPGEWIALMALFVTILGVVTVAAVNNAREHSKTRMMVIETIRTHEIECANHEPNSSVQIQALREHG
jgi:hypothetical protein